MKIFSEHSIDNVIKDSGILVGKDTLKRQCKIKENSPYELDNVGKIIKSALFLVGLKRYGYAKVTLS